MVGRLPSSLLREAILPSPAAHPPPLRLVLHALLIIVHGACGGGHGAADDTTEPSLPPTPSPLVNVTRGCLDVERRALLQFKAGLEDPNGLLSSWQGLDCCRWRGVACDVFTGAVVKLDVRNTFHGSSSLDTGDDLDQYLRVPNSDRLVCYTVTPSHAAGISNRSVPSQELKGTSSNRYGLSGRIHPSLLHLKSLRHLDLSDNSFHGTTIPAFIGSFKRLSYLNLSDAGFAGAVPPQIGNLSCLEYLDLSSDFLGALRVDGLRWVLRLSSLRHLAMDGVNLSAVGSDWVQLLNGQLPSLVELHINFCSLRSIPSSSHLANSTSLEVINLAGNHIYSRIPSWLPNITSLVHVDVRWNHLHGSIPVGFSNLPNLEYLDLSVNGNLTADVSELLGQGGWPRINTLRLYSNKFRGKIPASIGNLTSLLVLDLSSNRIDGEIPASIGKLCQLTELYLSRNNLTGDLPESFGPDHNCSSTGHRLPPLPRLVRLSLDGNSLTGNLPLWLYGHTGLEVLGASSNQFTGIVEEANLSNLRNLRSLRLNHNSLTLDVGANWMPPFQLKELGVGSCRLGPKFPSWIKTQGELRWLDLSENGILGEAPLWFWDLSSDLVYLNISFNGIRGQVPSSWSPSPRVQCLDMSSNMLRGHLPSLARPVELCVLRLSANRFNGPIWPNIGELMPSLVVLYLADNCLTGEIPGTIGELHDLHVLDLSKNNLTGGIPTALLDSSSLRYLNLGSNDVSGAIPTSIGRLRNLKALLLSNNMLSGEIPLSITNCSALEILDLGHNLLYGNIPTWMERLRTLRILRLRSNRFSGEIPTQISNLKLLQVLDVAENTLTGPITEKLGSLTGMMSTKKFDSLWDRGYYNLTLIVNTKGLYLEFFIKVDFLVTSIDLSGNKLSGEIPKSLMNLSSLVSLDLSCNLLTGTIPDRIGDMRQLQSLDLSNNNFSGRIPPSMQYLTFLSYLNLSNNNFSGSIPVGGQLGTFSDASFLRNSYLCGPMLQSNCLTDNLQTPNVNKDVNPHVDGWFYTSLGLGFAFGLLVPFVILVIKRSWSAAYFQVVDWIIDKLF